MTEKAPINKSVFAEEFSNIESQEIFLLSKDNALDIWRKHIDKKSSSYFDLPDNNWIIMSGPIVIGQWLPDFNAGISQNVEAILNSSISWNDNDVIWFCISKYLIIESSWKFFKQHWINFIECEDDCPILVNSKYDRNAFVFYPIGNIAQTGFN